MDDETEATIEDDIRDILCAITIRGPETVLRIITSLALLARHKDQPEEYARILKGAEQAVLKAWIDWVIKKGQANLAVDLSAPVFA
jgi:hypothetical protein